jgi:hypothetical protein
MSLTAATKSAINNPFLPMASRVPLEVIEQIIKYNDNLSSIKACALVCQFFLPLCRKLIFASVTLNDSWGPYRTTDDLNSLLTNSPHLAVYIRKLVYYVPKTEFVTTRPSWISPMFKKLVKLQKLTISPTLFSPVEEKLDWMSLSDRKALLPLLHLTTLTSISLNRIKNFLLADLAGCVNLKDLELESLECWNDAGKFLEPLHPTLVMLEILAISAGNIELVQLLCDARRPDRKRMIDFSSLKEIRSDAVQLHSMTEVFRLCRNLQKIDLTRMSLPRLTFSSI